MAQLSFEDVTNLSGILMPENRIKEPELSKEFKPLVQIAYGQDAPPIGSFQPVNLLPDSTAVILHSRGTFPIAVADFRDVQGETKVEGADAGNGSKVKAALASLIGQSGVPRHVFPNSWSNGYPLLILTDPTLDWLDLYKLVSPSAFMILTDANANALLSKRRTPSHLKTMSCFKLMVENPDSLKRDADRFIAEQMS